MPAEFGTKKLFSDANLQAYWPLENVNDSSSNAYNLTNNGTTAFAAAKYGNGGSFNGSSQWLSIPNASAPDLYSIGDQTICGWINPTNFTGLRSIISNTNASVNAGFSFQMEITTGKLEFRSFKSGDDQSVLSSAGISSGALSFVAVSYTSSGQAVSLFINDVKSTGTFSRAMVASVGDFAIGRLGSFNAQYFLGLIDDVQFFDRTLTDIEISRIYLTQLKKIAGVNYANIKKIAGVTSATLKKVMSIS